MSYSTGLFWAHQGAGITTIGSADDPYGSGGSLQTEATLQAAVDADQIARIQCSNATAIMVMPLLGSIVTGGGGTDAKFSAYGVITQGEPSTPQAQDGDKFLYRLGVPIAAAVTSGNITATSAWTIDSPEGFTFAHHANQDGGNHTMEPFVMPIAMSGSNIPDGAEGTLEDTEGGFTIFPGIDAFQEIILTFNDASLDASQRFNALVSLLY